MITDDRFHQLLLKELAELRQDTMEKLASGQWAGGKDASQVGMEAMKRIGFLQALDKVVELCEQVAYEMHK